MGRGVLRACLSVCHLLGLHSPLHAAATWLALSLTFPKSEAAAQSREPSLVLEITWSCDPMFKCDKEDPQGFPSPQLKEHRHLFIAWTQTSSCLHPMPSLQPLLQHYNSLSWSHTELLLGKEQDPFKASEGSSSVTTQCREPFHFLCHVSLKTGPLISQVDIFFHIVKAHFKLLSAK